MGVTEVITAGLIMGAVSSLHCIGMCGPLAVSLPVVHKSEMGRVVGGLTYNSGRILTYSVLGIVTGFAGGYLFATKYQNILSISLGILILIYLLPLRKIRVLSFISLAANKPFLKLKGALGRLFRSKKYSSLFAIGILNGLLPCGMIYLALSSSFITGTALKGSMFMLFFGLGTFPVMLSVVFLGNLFGQQLRLRIKKAVPLILLAMALLLVMRGLSLGIPYISPLAPAEATVPVSCH